MGKKNKKPPKESEGHPPKEALRKDGGLSRRFKEVLIEIFGRFDLDADGMLCDSELQAFSRVANEDGREFTAAELSEMKTMFHWKSEVGEISGLTLRGFVQLYERQTAISEEETWSDLNRLGYDSRLSKLPESRTVEELEEDLKRFSASAEKLLVLDSADKSQSLHLADLAVGIGLECRMLHTEASEIPCLHVFKRPEPLPESVRRGSPTAGSGKGAPVFVGLELDADSCKQLLNVFGDFLPSGWQVFAHHMTICLGSLADARSNDTEASEELQESIRQLRPSDGLVLQPVSVGKADGVIALGVIGCPSVNRVPHITLACAKGHRPVESNKISQWSALPADKLIALTGNVREYQQAEVAAGLTASVTQDRQELLRQLETLEAEVLAARAICMKQLLESDDQSIRRAVDERQRELATLRKAGDGEEAWEIAKPVKGKPNKKSMCATVKAPCKVTIWGLYEIFVQELLGRVQGVLSTAHVWWLSSLDINTGPEALCELGHQLLYPSVSPAQHTTPD